MIAASRKLENQVNFWSLLGPFFVLLSLAVLLFKVSPHWYFPVSALVGIPLCVKWKMKGMAFALSALFFLAAFNFQNLELDDRYWHVGLSLTMAFSFIVLTLSLEEAQGLVGKLQVESQSRLDNFLLLDEKWNNAELEWEKEREKIKSETMELSLEAAKLQEDKQTFYKLAQLAKDELVQVRRQHEQLLQDLSHKKQQISQLNERIDDNEITIQNFVNSDAEKQMQVLADQLATIEREKDSFKTKLAQSLEEGQVCQIEQERLWQEVKAFQEREKIRLVDVQRAQHQQEELQKTNLILENKSNQIEKELEGKRLELETLREEMEERLRYQEKVIKEKEEAFKTEYHKLLTERPAVHHSQSRSVEALYEQLKEQFEEKSNALNEARKELFKVNEQLLKAEKEFEEKQVYEQSKVEEQLQKQLLHLGRQFEQMQLNYQQEIDELYQLVDHLLKETKAK